MTKISRRKFLTLGLLALPAVAGVDARLIEPTRLRVRHLNLNGGGNCRFVHCTDLHHKGNVAFAEEVIRAINALAPQFVCFTGDLVEDRKFATEALGFIRQIKAPVYGVPGNHDYASHAPFDQYATVFRATGGAWMTERSVVLPQHELELVGMDIVGLTPYSRTQQRRRILLMHYPAMADRLGGRRFDLILAGHSHGGQVRLPFLGSIVTPSGTGPYDLGLYETAGGPLHVNAGIGTLSPYPVRLNCPPEITLITM